jgi:hypothetical protein
LQQHTKLISKLEIIAGSIGAEFSFVITKDDQIICIKNAVNTTFSVTQGAVGINASDIYEKVQVIICVTTTKQSRGCEAGL